MSQLQCAVQCENVLVVVAWTALELGACADTGRGSMRKANPELKGRSEKKGPGERQTSKGATAV